MKKFIFIACILLFSATSCLKEGETEKMLDNAGNLPPELKGLKVYAVGIGNGNVVKVAILNNNVNSVTYSEGKVEVTTLIINSNTNNSRIIEVKEILSETDDIIVIRKK